MRFLVHSYTVRPEDYFMEGFWGIFELRPESTLLAHRQQIYTKTRQEENIMHLRYGNISPPSYMKCKQQY